MFFRDFPKKSLILNLDKRLFSKETLEYFGFIFLKNSKKPSVSKILALKEAKRPQDIKGVRSYLGMINKLSNPIRKLTHQDIKLMKRKTLSDYPQVHCKRTKMTMLTLYLIHLVL